jgi:hypothetical protein
MVIFDSFSFLLFTWMPELRINWLLVISAASVFIPELDVEPFSEVLPTFWFELTTLESFNEVLLALISELAVESSETLFSTFLFELVMLFFLSESTAFPPVDVGSA